MKKTMKTIFLFLTSVLCAILSHSQVNYPLIAPNKIWSIVDQDPHGGPTTTSAYKFENDTVINGKHYYFIYECNLDSTFSNWILYSNYFIREDSTGNTYRLINDNELKIYDFNLQVGDSIFTGVQIGGQDVYAIVDTVDFVLVNGISRKRIVFDPYFEETWIEGIGSLNHIIFPFSRLSTFYFNLSCVIEYGSTIYQSSQFEDCYVYIVGIKEGINNPSILKITPNPLSGQSTIEIEESFRGMYQLQLINSLGQILRVNTFYGNKYVILKDGLSPGLYIIKISSPFSCYYSRLIVK